jgi:hypothetical protein
MAWPVGVVMPYTTRVRRIAMILDAGTPTRFAFEGAYLHGVRSHLCLSGSTWSKAHQCARLVVTLALHRIRASAPDVGARPA